MALAASSIFVRPSSGNGDNSPIPAQLIAYCDALRLAEPRQSVTTSNVEADVAQMHVHAQRKAEKVSASTFGIIVTWSPRFHTVDPANPAVWSNDVNKRGVLYGATMTDGTQAAFSLSTA